MLKRLIATISLSGALAMGGNMLPNNELQLSLLAQAAQNKLIVLSNMHLKGEAKDKFGNLYDDYQKDLAKVRLEKLKLIREYAKSYKSMSDKQADKLLTEWLKVQKDELNLKEQYISKFRKILPASTVLRFFQIDNRMSLLREARVSSLIPLAIPESATSKPKVEAKAETKEKK